jgi:serine/threonine protein kinase
MGGNALEAGTEIAGDYTIEEVLGEGGFAITYLARDRSLNNRVAIKEFFPNGIVSRTSDGKVWPAYEEVAKRFVEERQHFVREAAVLARLRHDNVVRVYRIFEANNTAYIVLEHIPGGDLEVAITRGSTSLWHETLSSDDFRNFFEPLIDALAYLHENALLHCDIKPANILLRPNRGGPVLIDFGAARLQGDTTSSTLTRLTESYAPMEAYVPDSRKHMGPWTDIYCLAAVMYRVLTGKSPPPAPDRAIEDSIESLQQLASLRRLAGIDLSAIDWALSVPPSKRPKTAAEWKSRLFAGHRRSEKSGSSRGAERKIFISYRRTDTDHIAGRIHDRLSARYTKDRVFFDVDTIPLGADFLSHVKSSLGMSAIVIAIVGPGWFGKGKWEGLLGNIFGQRKDYVQIELEVASELNIPIVPVLVNGATAATLSTAPASLVAMQYLNAATVRPGRDFHRDMDMLEMEIDGLLRRIT